MLILIHECLNGDMMPLLESPLCLCLFACSCVERRDGDRNQAAAGLQKRGKVDSESVPLQFGDELLPRKVMVGYMSFSVREHIPPPVEEIVQQHLVEAQSGNRQQIDLTLESQTLAGESSWEVIKESTIGSDHYPIFTNIGVERGAQEDTEGRRRLATQNGTSIEE